MRREYGAAAAIFIALSVAMTWPLALNLGRAVSDPGDPFVNIWILDWDWWATLHQPLGLFHANALHPARYTLAVSEHLYGIAMLLFPLRLVGVGPLTAYNIAMLAGFAFCGFAAFLLGRRITGSFAAGLAAGIFYAFVPFRFVHLPHLQHVWGGWIPLLLAALLWYVEQPSSKRAALFAVAFAMNGLTNMHYFLFGSFAVMVTALPLLRRDTWRPLAVATLVAIACIAPFLYPYHRVADLYGTDRPLGEVAHYSATPADWIRDPAEPERRLFPGAYPLVIAAAGLILARRRIAQIVLALLWIAVGFAGSLGVNFEFHRFLYGAVPGFSGMRVAARWAVIAYVGLAILIALAVAEVARRSRPVAMIIAGGFVVALWPAPIRWWIADPAPPPVYRWLAAQNVSAVVELPIDAILSEYRYLFRSTAHHKPMINGIPAGPELRNQLSAQANATPIPDPFVDALQSAGVELVIVHGDTLWERGGETRRWLREEIERGRMSFVRRFDAGAQGDWVFAIGERNGRPLPAELEFFLSGVTVCGSSPVGVLESPAHHAVVSDRMTVTGWAMSPLGIDRVDLWFNSGTIRKSAKVIVDRSPEQHCAGNTAIQKFRFETSFDTRPEGIREEADVFVEITDRSGRKAIIEDRFFTWKKNDE